MRSKYPEELRAAVRDYYDTLEHGRAREHVTRYWKRTCKEVRSRLPDDFRVKDMEILDAFDSHGKSRRRAISEKAATS